MGSFMIRFLISNLFISCFIGILLTAKGIFKYSLTNRMQYNLWYVMLGLLWVPFIPLRISWLPQIFSWPIHLKDIAYSTEKAIEKNIDANASAIHQMNDYFLSAGKETPSVIGFVLFGIWIIGILVMISFIIRSKIQLKILKKSALPLQNKEVRNLYDNCLKEMKISSDISIYSTAFLESPIITGLFRPIIYLPIHLISDYDANNMRYMLLHELQHFKHKDALADYLMNFSSTLYWFNPLIWYALKEMRVDREVACDTSVLKLLKESEYEDYGNALINLAEKISLTPFPFAVGISGSFHQIRKRILNIASYKKPSTREKLKGAFAFCFITMILSVMAPMLSTYAADQSYYKWNTSSKNISVSDLSAYFNEYKGSFVLYDSENDAWTIHDMDYAILRTSPDSTYKIYSALFGLEENVITPHNSFIAWNGEKYPFETWNVDQNLYSAMQSSVNWYFQTIDKRLGFPTVKRYIQQIEYGNQNTNSDISTFWMESSLKISPVEQVELLTNFYNNNYNFALENINVVKDSICLFSSNNKNFYGKTGTGNREGQDINGWFIGFIEAESNTYFFATNIQNNANATGSIAVEITMSILSDMNIWQQ